MTDREEHTVYEYEGPPRITLSRIPVSGAEATPRYQHRLEAQGGRLGAVVIGRREGKVAMVWVSRPLIAHTALELPRGFGEVEDARPDAESTAIATATREYLEETGLTLTDARVLGTLLIDTGIYPQPVAVVTGNTHGDVAPVRDAAIRKVEWLSRAELRARVTQGEIADALSLAALQLWNTSNA